MGFVFINDHCHNFVLMSNVGLSSYLALQTLSSAQCAYCAQCLSLSSHQSKVRQIVVTLANFPGG